MNAMKVGSLPQRTSGMRKKDPHKEAKKNVWTHVPQQSGMTMSAGESKSFLPAKRTVGIVFSVAIQRHFKTVTRNVVALKRSLVRNGIGGF